MQEFSVVVNISGSPNQRAKGLVAGVCIGVTGAEHLPPVKSLQSCKAQARGWEADLRHRHPAGRGTPGAIWSSPKARSTNKGAFRQPPLLPICFDIAAPPHPPENRRSRRTHAEAGLAVHSLCLTPPPAPHPPILPLPGKAFRENRRTHAEDGLAVHPSLVLLLLLFLLGLAVALLLLLLLLFVPTACGEQ